MVRLRIFAGLLLFVHLASANPVISKIMNSSDIGYRVIHHTDESTCSFRGKDIMIHARQIFEHAFLLEAGKPSLILRPCYYIDPSGKKIDFLDVQNNIVNQNLNEAFKLWKNGKGKSWRKIKEAQQWMDQWVGGDIEVFPHDVQMFGYLLNRSRVIVKNKINQQSCWLSFAKGIFAKLLLEVDIIQDKNKPMVVKIRALHGSGGVCVDGTVEKI